MNSIGGGRELDQMFMHVWSAYLSSRYECIMLQGTTSAPSEVAKFKGHINESGRPVGASSSPRGDYIICGSDDGRVFVWPCSQVIESKGLTKILGQ